MGAVTLGAAVGAPNMPGIGINGFMKRELRLKLGLAAAYDIIADRSGGGTAGVVSFMEAADCSGFGTGGDKRPK